MLVYLRYAGALPLHYRYFCCLQSAISTQSAYMYVGMPGLCRCITLLFAKCNLYTISLRDDGIEAHHDALESETESRRAWPPRSSWPHGVIHGTVTHVTRSVPRSRNKMKAHGQQQQVLFGPGDTCNMTVQIQRQHLLHALGCCGWRRASFII